AARVTAVAAVGVVPLDHRARAAAHLVRRAARAHPADALTFAASEAVLATVAVETAARVAVARAAAAVARIRECAHAPRLDARRGARARAHLARATGAAIERGRARVACVAARRSAPCTTGADRGARRRGCAAPRAGARPGCARARVGGRA